MGELVFAEATKFVVETSAEDEVATRDRRIVSEKCESDCGAGGGTGQHVLIPTEFGSIRFKRAIMFVDHLNKRECKTVSIIRQGRCHPLESTGEKGIIRIEDGEERSP